MVQKIGQLEASYQLEASSEEERARFIDKLLEIVRSYPFNDSLRSRMKTALMTKPITISSKLSSTVEKLQFIESDSAQALFSRIIRQNKIAFFTFMREVLAEKTRRQAFELESDSTFAAHYSLIPRLATELDRLMDTTFNTSEYELVAGQSRQSAMASATAYYCFWQSYRALQRNSRLALAYLGQGLRSLESESFLSHRLELLTDLQFILYDKLGKTSAAIALGNYIIKQAAGIDYELRAAKALVFNGNAWVDRSYYEHACRSLRQALQTYKKYDHTASMRMVYERLCGPNQYLGRMELALAQLDSSIGGSEANQHPGARYHLTKGIILCKMGNFGQAKSELARAAVIAEANRQPHILVTALDNLGMLHLRFSDKDSSIICLERAAAIESGIPFQRLESLLDLLRAHIEIGHLEEAQETAQKALSMLETHSYAPRLATESYRHLAVLARKIGNTKHAIALLQNALQSARLSGLVEDEYEILCLLADTYNSTQEYESAIQLLNKALALSQKYRGISFRWLAPYRLGQIAKQQRKTELAHAQLQQAIAELETAAASIQFYFQRASYSERIRPVFEEMVGVQLMLGDSSAAFSYSEQERAHALKNQLMSRTAKRNPSNQFARTASNGVPTLTEDHVARPIDIMKVLPPGTGMIEYEVMDSTLIAWTISQKGWNTTQVTLSRNRLQAMVQDFLSHFTPDSIRTLTQIERSYKYLKEAGKELYAALIEPLQNVSQCENLIIIPDEILYDLPFAALTKRDGRFLVHTVRFAQQASATLAYHDLLQARLTQPIYDLLAVVHAGLKNSQVEADSVAKMCKSARILVGDKISKPILQTALQKKTDLVLFSTHGKIDPRFPANSYLEFRSAHPDSTSDDGKLNLAEIQALELEGTRLVYIAACESATGKSYRGEGNITLQRAFLIAGADCVIANRWKIDDQKTMMLTTGFFDAWLKQGLDKLTALQHAQISVLQSLLDQGFYPPHPYFWAPATLIGNIN